MTDLEYMDQAERLLKAIEAACDRINADTDADIDNRRSGGVVTLQWPNASQIVVNLQKPLHEVWLAARAGGFHFKWDGQQWLSSKDGREFYATLSACASEQCGLALCFTPQG